MAELHFILIQKKENHGLNSDDESWFDFTEPFYDKFQSALDTKQITINLVTARLQGQNTLSTIFEGEFVTLPLLSTQRKKIDAALKEPRYGKWLTQMNPFKKEA